jgi:hypothetical protein
VGNADVFRFCLGRQTMIKKQQLITLSIVTLPMTTRSAEPERDKEEWQGYEVEQRETLGVL